MVLLYFIIYFCCPAVFADTRYYYVLTLFTLSSAATLLLSSFAENLLFFVPYTLFAIMYQAFMPPKDIAPIYIVSLSPLLMSSHSGPMLFFIFAVSGLVMIFIFKYFQQGWKQFIASVLNFAMVAAMYLGFLASGLIPSGDWGSVLGLLVGSVFTVAGYPLVYLFERIFNMVSNSRLLELCDTSNPLIRTLEQKAPGTFQHSLQVMNMADAVARSVGVNPDLVRAGALYHDIGKMLNPLCFIENEFVVKDGAHYHDGLTPQQSAHDILRHVPDGVEIAQKHRLPKVIIDFISSHHGTTVVRYFYEKFLTGGGDPAQIGDFRYDGRKPRDKAQIVLMLCDSIEAASRTLKGNSEKIYSDFVESIVDGKMSEGQFDDADITIREINAAKQTLKEYLAQLNHERIVYSQNRLDDLNLELTIEVEAADYAETEKKRLAERRRNADFKGFRKGMVPASLIKKVYGEQCLAEAVNKVVSDALEAHITENKLHILGEPLSSEKQPELEWTDGNTFTFVFDLGLSPEISLELGKDDTVPSYTVSVAAKDKGTMVENLKKFYEEKKEEKSDEDIDKEASERLESQYKNEAEWRLGKDIRDYVVAKAALSLPEEFLKRWLLAVNKDKLSKEDIDKEFDGFAADFKWQLVRGYLMQKYGFKVDEKDLREAAEAYVTYQYAMYGIGNVPKEMIQEAVVNVLHDQRQAERIVEQVEEQKVLSKLKEELTLKPTKITSTKFRELK